MKSSDLRSHFKAARWAALGQQAQHQGVDFAKVSKEIRAMADAKYPDNPSAAIAFAAIRLLIACNSKPTPEDLAAMDKALATPTKSTTTQP